MKRLVFLAGLFSAAAIASAQATPVVKWVGQIPAEQATPAVEAFNATHGAKLGFSVQYVYDEAAVKDLLEGKSRAEFDLVHMKDADMLNTLARSALITPIVLADKNLIPVNAKDPQNQWIGILKRARILYYNSDLVNPADLQSYEDLGKEQFKDKLCLRQKKAQYNIGLYSFFLDVWGEAKTAAVLKSWATNSAAVPLLEKDLDHVILKVASGECAVGVANTYYYARHLRATPDTKVKFVMPNQKDIGAHINVDGVAVLKDSQNSVEAQVFANWLLTKTAQTALSEATDKLPVNPSVATKSTAVFGAFKENQSFNLNKITDLKDAALTLATEQGLK